MRRRVQGALSKKRGAPDADSDVAHARRDLDDATADEAAARARLREARGKLAHVRRQKYGAGAAGAAARLEAATDARATALHELKAERARAADLEAALSSAGHDVAVEREAVDDGSAADAEAQEAAIARENAARADVEALEAELARRAANKAAAAAAARQRGVAASGESRADAELAAAVHRAAALQQHEDALREAMGRAVDARAASGDLAAQVLAAMQRQGGSMLLEELKEALLPGEVEVESRGAEAVKARTKALQLIYSLVGAGLLKVDRSTAEPTIHSLAM